jgi:hypothetical protein
MDSTRITRAVSFGLALQLLSLTGCGSRQYPVRGSVTLGNGTPITKGMVVFESTDGSIMARGTIQSNGSYELSTSKPGDGLQPGRYKVLVNPLDMSDVPDDKKKLPFDVKYTHFETSGLVVDVKAEPNDIPITLSNGP